MKWLFLLVVIILIAACEGSKPTAAEATEALAGSEATQTERDFTPARVTKVIDGDTIDVLLNDSVQRVRLIGINTPETVAPGRPVDCWGAAASARAKELMEGQRVELETDPTQGDKDFYGRLLRYVWLDGVNVAEALIERGDGEEYTYSKAYKHQKAFQGAERRAKEAGAGLWGACKSGGARSGSHPDQNGPDRDCGDFTIWRDAQDFYEAAGGPEIDRHRLDGDGDGVACEGLR